MKTQRCSSAKARLEQGSVISGKSSFLDNINNGSKRPQSAFENGFGGSQKRSQTRERPSAKLTICSVGQPKNESPLISREGNPGEIFMHNGVCKRRPGNEDRSASNWKIPSSLGPLGQWLCQCIPTELTGMKGDCLMFLPSLLTQRPEDLEVMPPPQKAGDNLVFTSVIHTEPMGKVTKKYDHPWKRLPIQEHKCNHSKRTNLDALRIYSSEGELLHETFTGARNENIVRKEIKELEDLMKGIGNEEGVSLVVQYQAQIHEIQSMLAETMPRVEEIKRREAEKLAALKPADSFGFHEFVKLHDEVMLRIKNQWEACVEELAVMEEELGIVTPKSHFKHRSKSLT